MMNFRAFVLFVLLIHFSESGSGSAVAHLQNVRSGPYIFCNVFLSSACFGIAQGDKLSMEVIADYVLYHVTFSFGRSATIYSGFNPDLTSYQNVKFENCHGLKGFSECKKRKLDDGRLEFVARRDKDSPFIHVSISRGEDGDSIITSFLQNIRSCNRDRNDIRCRDLPDGSSVKSEGLK